MFFATVTERASNMSYIILDLDETISDDRWRQKEINLNIEGMERWHNYHLLAGFDDVCNEQLFRDTGCEIIIATGRYVLYAPITLEWLRRKNILAKIIMFRPNKDTRSPAELKHEQINTLIMQHGVKTEEIFCAYDDCHATCEMYRKRGIDAIQVLNCRKDNDETG